MKLNFVINDDDKEIKDKILLLLDCEEMSVWEYDFVNNISDIEYNFTESQKEKVIEIFDSYF